MDYARMIADLNSIIRLQSDIIDGLYAVASQYMSMDEIGDLTEAQLWQDIKTVASLKKQMGGDCDDTC